MRASARTGGHRALTEAGPRGGEGHQAALTAPWLRPQPHLPAGVGELHLPPPWTPTGFRWTCEPAPGGPCIFPGVGIQTLVTENTEPGTRHRRPESRAQATSPQTQSPRDHRSARHLLRPAVLALAPTCPLPGHKRVPAWAGLRKEGQGQARVRGRGSWGRDMDGPWRAGLRTMQLLDSRRPCWAGGARRARRREIDAGLRGSEELGVRRLPGVTSTCTLTQPFCSQQGWMLAGSPPC